jgi:hypothetical protein
MVTLGRYFDLNSYLIFYCEYKFIINIINDSKRNAKYYLINVIN